MENWFGPGGLDRADAHRSDLDWLRRRWADPRTRLLTVGPRGVVGFDVERLTPQQPEGELDPQRHFLLGLVGEVAWFATTGEPSGPAESLRTVLPAVDDTERDLAATAVALTNWHAGEAYCPGCGALTVVGVGGFTRSCPVCGRTLFPRTDPAVIVAVLDADGRLLLGHQVSWDRGRVSLFAGFVEAGESLEQAVHRELAEESGVRLREVRYLASQPWPFPRSLMLGFAAWVTDPAYAVDGVEIEWAEWFTPQSLTEGVDSGRILLPGHASIARRIIEAWRSGSLA